MLCQVVLENCIIRLPCSDTYQQHQDKLHLITQDSTDDQRKENIVREKLLPKAFHAVNDVKFNGTTQTTFKKDCTLITSMSSTDLIYFLGFVFQVTVCPISSNPNNCNLIKIIVQYIPEC